jgi:hypothetical protein
MQVNKASDFSYSNPIFLSLSPLLTGLNLGFDLALEGFDLLIEPFNMTFNIRLSFPTQQRHAIALCH